MIGLVSYAEFLRETFERFFPMKIALCFLVILLILESNSSGAQQPSATPTPTATPTPFATPIDAHTCCYSAPAVSPAHFTVTPRSSVAQPDFRNCYPSWASMALAFEIFENSRKSKARRGEYQGGLMPV